MIPLYGFENSAAAAVEVVVEVVSNSAVLYREAAYLGTQGLISGVRAWATAS
jgi:hypothetical protein